MYITTTITNKGSLSHVFYFFLRKLIFAFNIITIIQILIHSISKSWCIWQYDLMLWICLYLILCIFFSHFYIYLFIFCCWWYTLIDHFVGRENMYTYNWIYLLFVLHRIRSACARISFIEYGAASQRMSKKQIHYILYLISSM